MLPCNSRLTSFYFLTTKAYQHRNPRETDRLPQLTARDFYVSFIVCFKPCFSGVSKPETPTTFPFSGPSRERPIRALSRHGWLVVITVRFHAGSISDVLVGLCGVIVPSSAGSIEFMAHSCYSPCCMAMAMTWTTCPFPSFILFWHLSTSFRWPVHIEFSFLSFRQWQGIFKLSDINA